MPTTDEPSLRRRADGPAEASETPSGDIPVGHVEASEADDSVGLGYPLKWWIVGGLFLALEFSFKYLAHLHHPEGLITDILAPVISFHLCYVENRHSAFSFARGLNRDMYRLMMASSVFLVVGAFVYFFFKRDAIRLNKLGVFTFMIGAIGNGLDRILLGAVVDYVDITGGYPDHWSSYYLAWNLSDLVINAAFAILVYQAYLTERAASKGSGGSGEKKKRGEAE
ncbi:hypothetical protein FOZ61_009469 [Perkinsus olseni]|uniref:Lipoprotein signal peptidase n=1 Tax=Perkinsus olseni TaxID=32597 RepID=A0A7J6KZS4_PEROL|nr:hypothetical protein FOZ61_009469 [Perkinsus olseni]